MNPLFIPHAANERRTRWRPAYYLAQLAAAEVSRDESGVTYDRDLPPFAPVPRDPNAPRPNPVAPRAVVVDWTARGPKLWQDLHQRPRESTDDDTAWLEAFARRVPCGSCRQHWREWVKTNPPPAPLTFEWTHAAHQAVNERLGKPGMTLDEARRHWGF